MPLEPGEAAPSVTDEPSRNVAATELVTDASAGEQEKPSEDENSKDSYIISSCCLAAMMVGGGVTAAATSVVTLPVLAAFGFGAMGPIAGGLAANWQAGMAGYVAAGSLFAKLQALAMTGGFTATTTLSVSGAAAGAASAFCGTGVVTSVCDTLPSASTAWQTVRATASDAQANAESALAAMRENAAKGMETVSVVAAEKWDLAKDKASDSWEFVKASRDWESDLETSLDGLETVLNSISSHADQATASVKAAWTRLTSGAASAPPERTTGSEEEAKAAPAPEAEEEPNPIQNGREL